MARTGILYSHLVKAAEKVVSEGKNPTVDSVREALGGTGSKSTIAPLLKRWKAEHQEQLVEVDVGVPAQLLLAVKGVYDKLQADVRQQLELAGAAQALALEVAARRVEQSETECRELSRSNSALLADLNQTKDEFAQLRAEHQVRAVALATLESDKAGLRERLGDRGAEVGALNQQLTQARKQFEHFQEASAAQRIDANPLKIVGRARRSARAPNSARRDWTGIWPAPSSACCISRRASPSRRCNWAS